MISYELTIPLPPTVNHAYGTSGHRRYLKPAGVEFRQQVALAVRLAKLTKLEGRLWLFMRVYPRDRRAIDLDNRVKACQDALQHAGVYEDDSQIDHLEVKRGPVTPGGRCELTIGVIDAPR